MVSLNVYAGDPRLLRYYLGSTGISPSEFATNPAVIQAGGEHCSIDYKVVAGYGSGAQSPWIVALQSSSLCQFSSITNGFLVFLLLVVGMLNYTLVQERLIRWHYRVKPPNFSHTAIDLEYLIMRYYLQDHLDYWHSLALMNRQQWFSKILPV